MKEFTYEELVAKADAVKEIMGTEPVVFLRPSAGPMSLPFNRAHSFEPGGTVRFGVITSGWFVATVKGIHAKWSFDLESWGDNGTSSLNPRIHACREVMRQLEGRARDQFRGWLLEVAAKLREEAQKSQGFADQLNAKAAAVIEVSGAVA